MNPPAAPSTALPSPPPPPVRPSRLRFTLVTIVALAGIAVTAALGRWQLSRAAQKEALFEATQRQGALAPLDARALEVVRPDAGDEAAHAAAREALVHRRVLLRGHWLPRYTVYLDNRQMEARQGFYVTTPLQLEGEGAAGLVVLVQRGWVPRNFEDRSRLQPVETPAGTVEVAGQLAGSPGRLFEFGGGGTTGAPAEGSSPIRQNLDLAAYRRETGLPLASLSVVQAGAASEGLQRAWPPATAGVERNYGYAFQWFGLCALIVFLYVWFQFLRRAPWRRRA